MEFLKLHKKMRDALGEKLTRLLSRPFVIELAVHKRGYQIANKCMKKCSSSIIMKIQGQRSFILHLSPGQN